MMEDMTMSRATQRGNGFVIVTANTGDGQAWFQKCANLEERPAADEIDKYRADWMASRIADLEDMIEHMQDKESCEWSEGNEGVWQCSACDLEWQFSDGETPSENQQYYCPKCGRKITKETEYAPESDGDDE